MLGTTIEEIQRMSNIEQIKYIKKYLFLISNGKKYKCATNLYLAILYPQAMYKSDAFIIGAKESNTVKWNRPLDSDKDSILTVKDVKTFLIASL